MTKASGIIAKSLFSVFNNYFFSFQKCYQSRLEEIRDTLETSPFFKAHEVKTQSAGQTQHNKVKSIIC